MMDTWTMGAMAAALAGLFGLLLTRLRPRAPARGESVLSVSLRENAAHWLAVNGCEPHTAVIQAVTGCQDLGDRWKGHAVLRPRQEVGAWVGVDVLLDDRVVGRLSDSAARACLQAMQREYHRPRAVRVTVLVSPLGTGLDGRPARFRLEVAVPGAAEPGKLAFAGSTYLHSADFMVTSYEHSTVQW
jgi:hypothetical protein